MWTWQERQNLKQLQPQSNQEPQLVEPPVSVALIQGQAHYPSHRGFLPPAPGMPSPLRAQEWTSEKCGHHITTHCFVMTRESLKAGLCTFGDQPWHVCTLDVEVKLGSDRPGWPGRASTLTSESDHRRGTRLEEGTNQSSEPAGRWDQDGGICETDDVTRAEFRRLGGSAGHRGE